MALTDQKALSNDGAFTGRVEIALITAAIAVINEDPGTAKHALRVAYARRVLEDPSNSARRMTLGVVTNSTIAATAPTGSGATDGDIQFVVNGLVDAYAS